MDVRIGIAALVVALFAAGLAPAPIPGAAAAPATSRAPVAAPDLTRVQPGSFGTASIDGIQGSGEWATAARLALDATVPAGAGGGLVPVTVLLMNDHDNLYVAIRVAGRPWGVRTWLRFEMATAPPHDAVADVVGAFLPPATSLRPLPVLDSFLARRDGEQPDTWTNASNPVAGTADGATAGAVAGDGSYLELSHPLHSGDARDIATQTGRVLAFGLTVGILAPDPACTDAGACIAWTDFPEPHLMLAQVAGLPSAPAAITGALVVRNARVSHASALPGASLTLTYDVVNASSQPLAIPLVTSTGRYTAAMATDIVERLGPDPGIGAQPRGNQQTHWLDVVGLTGRTVWDPGVAAHVTVTLATTGFAPGRYLWRIDLLAPSRDPASGLRPFFTVAPAFTLLAIRSEWRAALGTGGRNGVATIRGLSDTTGVAVLQLTRLRPQATYTVRVVRGSCASPVTVDALATVTANASGAYNGTKAFGTAVLAAIRSAARSHPLYVRLTAGSSVVCSPLRVVPLYAASVGSWQMTALPEQSGSYHNGTTGALPTDVVATAHGFVAAGVDYGVMGPALAVWTSADGIAWDEQLIAAAQGRGGPVLGRHGTRLVLVASGRAFWSDDEGATWQNVMQPPGDSLPWGFYAALARTLVDTPAGLVLLTLPNAADGTPGHDSRAWISPDGRTWQLLPPATGLRDFCPVNLARASNGWLVAVGHDCNLHARAMRSTDGGRTWTRAAMAGLDASWGLHRVVSLESGFVAFGNGSDQRTQVFSSADGLTWRLLQTIAPPPGTDRFTVTDVERFGPGYVAVGGGTAAADWFQAAVLVSADGRTWRWAPYPLGMDGATMEAAATDGTRLVVVGDTYDMMGDVVTGYGWRAQLGAAP